MPVNIFLFLIFLPCLDSDRGERREVLEKRVEESLSANGLVRQEWNRRPAVVERSLTIRYRVACRNTADDLQVKEAEHVLL